MSHRALWLGCVSAGRSPLGADIAPRTHTRHQELLPKRLRGLGPPGASGLVTQEAHIPRSSARLQGNDSDHQPSAPNSTTRAITPPNTIRA